MKKTSTQPALIKKLGQSLLQENTDRNRKAWVAYLIKRQVPLRGLMPLLFGERVVAMRFSWLLGELCAQSPGRVYKVLPYMFNNRHKIGILHFNRSLAKFFYLAGLPPAIEAAAIDEMFNWVLDAGTGVSAKMFCVLALEKRVEKYPELKNELRLVISEQLGKNAPSFDQRAGRVLESLGG